MKSSFFAVALLCFFYVAVCRGEDSTLTKKVHTFGNTDSLDSATMAERFRKNAPADFPVTPVPGAVYVGKDSRFMLGVGGFVKTVVGADFGHPIDNPDEFITSQIPMEPMDGDNARFNLSARQTHLYINFIALPGSSDEIGAFVGANLLNDYAPALQYAYLRYRGMKAGFDNTLFSDPACGAPAVDYEGPCSNTASPVAGVSYIWSPRLRPQWELAAGIELPQASFTTIPGLTKYVYQRAPDIPLAVRYRWHDGASWVRLSAIFRTLTYRDIPASKNHSLFAYGLQASGAVYFLDRFTFFWQGVWGKGIGSMVQDTAGQGLDLVPSDGDRALSPAMLWGGFLSLQYNINSRFLASATYSQLRGYVEKYAGGSTEWPDLYKYTQYVSANIFCNVTSFFSVGLEHIWGRRVNQDGMKCADNRLQLALQLVF